MKAINELGWGIAVLVGVLTCVVGFVLLPLSLAVSKLPTGDELERY